MSFSMRPRRGSGLDEFFVRRFAHEADQVIALQSLSTGLASDVTGKLTIYNPAGRGDRRHLLYKVAEKNVELVASGLLSTSGRNDFANLT